MGRQPHEISSDQRQRIASASALIIESDLITLEEPLPALDMAARADILELLNGL